MPFNPWLMPGRIERLKKLWGEGMSAALIAMDLGGGITRNAVIGKVNRLKLAPRRTGSIIGIPRPRRRRPSRPMDPAKVKKLNAIRRLWFGPSDNRSLDPLPLPPPAESDIARVHFTDLDDKPITIIDADGTVRTVKRHCKWVVGEPVDGMFCGDERIEGLSYCRAHTLRAYHVPAPSSRPTNYAINQNTNTTKNLETV
jgi:GcrA cell cycle regulator